MHKDYNDIFRDLREKFIENNIEINNQKLAFEIIKNALNEAEQCGYDFCEDSLKKNI